MGEYCRFHSRWMCPHKPVLQTLVLDWCKFVFWFVCRQHTPLNTQTMDPIQTSHHHLHIHKRLAEFATEARLVQLTHAGAKVRSIPFTRGRACHCGRGNTGSFKVVASVTGVTLEVRTHIHEALQCFFHTLTLSLSPAAIHALRDP